VKRRKGFRKNRPLTQSWLGTNSHPAFRGYPVATLAFYGPNDKLATKVVVSVILAESNEPDILNRWFSEGDLDVRHDLAIGEQILAFLKPYAPRSTVVTDRIIGCPHEEGTDYPEGASCPQCPYWAGRDRFRIRLTIRPVGREGYGPVATGMKTDELYPAQTLASEPQALWMMPNRKAMVRPNTSIPSGILALP